VLPFYYAPLTIIDCLPVGQTFRDLDGNVRTRFGYVDMGAYEVTAIVDD